MRFLHCGFNRVSYRAMHTNMANRPKCTTLSKCGIPPPPDPLKWWVKRKTVSSIYRSVRQNCLKIAMPRIIINGNVIQVKACFVQFGGCKKRERLIVVGLKCNRHFGTFFQFAFYGDGTSVVAHKVIAKDEPHSGAFFAVCTRR